MTLTQFLLGLPLLAAVLLFAVFIVYPYYKARKSK
jgi:cell division protein FtsL